MEEINSLILRAITNNSCTESDLTLEVSKRIPISLFFSMNGEVLSAEIRISLSKMFRNNEIKILKGKIERVN
jgi:hypothetical protein